MAHIFIKYLKYTIPQLSSLLGSALDLPMDDPNPYMSLTKAKHKSYASDLTSCAIAENKMVEMGLGVEYSNWLTTILGSLNANNPISYNLTLTMASAHHRTIAMLVTIEQFHDKDS